MAEITERHHISIFDTTSQVIVNTVNCDGVMGRGLALEFKMRFPSMYERYRKTCERGLIHPGTLQLYTETTPWILNFPTKNHWKYPSKLAYIQAGLEKFVETYREKVITSVAFPKLGAASGKLDWNTVRKLMYKYLTPLPNLQVEIYHFDPDAKDSFFEKFYNRVNHFAIDDYIYGIGLSKCQATLLHEAVFSGSVNNMQGIQRIKGVGEKSLKAVYDFVNCPESGLLASTSKQLELF